MNTCRCGAPAGQFTRCRTCAERANAAQRTRRAARRAQTWLPCPACHHEVSPLSHDGMHKQCRNAQKLTAPRPCTTCGTAVTPPQRVCRACQLDVIRKHRRAHANARKSNKYGAKYTTREIGERDHWTCGICTEPIDQHLRHPDPASPSVDHITPIREGGPDETWNVQIAHLRCNIRKELVRRRHRNATRRVA